MILYRIRKWIRQNIAKKCFDCKHYDTCNMIHTECYNWELKIKKKKKLKVNKNIYKKG